jgi:hypothetical protein
MAFKAKQLSVKTLETYVQKRIAKALADLEKRRIPAAKPKAAKKRVTEPGGGDRVRSLVSVLKNHPKRAELVNAGKTKDQLVRSLIPLYLAKEAGERFEVTSGVVSAFWAASKVRFQAPNAAKALRQNPGYAKRTARGQVITAKGVAYVKAAL